MMDCRTCETTLVDLLYGELEPDRAREARGHLEGCEACTDSFERLQDGLALAEQLPLEEPPAQVTSRILELAAERARTVSVQQQASSPGLLRRLLDLLTGGAMATQVKMALVTAVVVAAVLWIVPDRVNQHDAIATGPVVSPHAQGEAAPSPGVSPADRLELQVDMRRARIRAKGSAAEPASRTSDMATAEEAAEPEALAEAEPSAQSADDEDALLEGLLDLESEERGAMGGPGKGGLVAEKKDAPAKESARDGLASSAGAVTERSKTVVRSRAAASPKPTAEPAPFPAQSAVGRAAPAPKRKAAPAADMRQELLNNAYGAPAAPQQQAPASPTPSSPSALLARAEQRAGAGDRRGALEDLATVASSAGGATAAEALLRRARLQRQWYGCRASDADYGQLVRLYPTSRQAGPGMLEHASCLRATGREAEARALLERATRHPAVASKAREALGAEPPAAAAEPAAPAEAESDAVQRQSKD